VNRLHSSALWVCGLAVAAAAPAAAQERAAASLEAAEKLSRATGRPILAVAGSET
jgi:hypothetical protein